MATLRNETGHTNHETPRVTVRTSAAQTAGALLELEAHYGPGSQYPPEHFHPLQDEHFEVLTGKIDVRLNGVEQIYRAGQSFDIPRGSVHTMRNGGDKEASVLWQVRPALRTQQFYQNLWGLSANGKTTSEGIPYLLQMAVMLQHYDDEFVLASPPRVVQQLAVPILALLGGLYGYRAQY